MKRGQQTRSLWRMALLAATALVVVNALAFFAFTLPRLDRSRRAEEYSRELRETTAAKRAEFERLSQRADSIQANTRDAKRFFSETIKPLPEALGPDLDAVEAAVRQSGLRAGRRAYDNRPLKDLPLIRYGIRLPLTGPSSQIGTLLRQLSRSPRFIVLERIAMRDDAEAGQTGRSDFDVELSTYYRTESSPTAGKKSSRAKTAPRR